jgi:formate hydrogenlyase subunit 6/NADH:ubiquinone oxidoreductase subunit I
MAPDLGDRQSAYTPNSGDCRGCGLCVVACPEDAIQLTRTGLTA